MIFSEDPDYLERWGRVLAAGKSIVTTMGTDCHRNTFTAQLQDGERVDSYRRMMSAFSNHLLVELDEEGRFDDRDLIAALDARRVFGVFEYLGHPVGFDVQALGPNGESFELSNAINFLSYDKEEYLEKYRMEATNKSTENEGILIPAHHINPMYLNNLGPVVRN